MIDDDLLVGGEDVCAAAPTATAFATLLSLLSALIVVELKKKAEER